MLQANHNRRSCRSNVCDHLQVELLEDRRLLAVLTVNSPLDDISPGDNLVTLREAMTAANNDTITDLGQTGSGADTILFDATAFGTPQTIGLTLGEIMISEAVTIDGPGQQILTIDAQQESRIVSITATTGDFTIARLSLTGGKMTESGLTGSGAAIRSLTLGSLSIDQSTVTGNTSLDAAGGGIFAEGNVMLSGSTVSGNYAYYLGGGTYTAAGDVTVTDSTISGNDSGYGGGIKRVNHLRQNPLACASSL